MIEIGRVAAVNRFPVKSMMGRALAAANLGWNGIEGDRQYAFVRAGDETRFPWLTGRDIAEMILHRADYLDAANPRHSPVRVATPEGEEFDLRDGALARRLAEMAGEAVRLIQLGRGTFDSAPVSVVTKASLAALGDRFGRPLEPARFRINLILDSDASERDWLGHTVAFGSEEGPRLRLDRPIGRCRMITIDPATAMRDPAILKMVAADFANEVGVYGTPDRPGTLHPGDPVWLM